MSIFRFSCSVFPISTRNWNVQLILCLSVLLRIYLLQNAERTFHVIEEARLHCTFSLYSASPGRVQGDIGWGFGQPGLEERIPGHDGRRGSR